MLRAAQLYYRLNLTQDQVGERLGVSRFKVGRLLDRALRESAVRIEIVHPAARLVELEDALVERFGLRGAVVVDVPATGSAADDELLARERVAAAAAAHLAALRPDGRDRRLVGPHDARARRAPAPGLDRRPPRSSSSTARSPARARPTRAQEVVERFGTHDRRRHPAHGRPGDRRLGRAPRGRSRTTRRSARRSPPLAPPPPRSSAWASWARTASTSRRATSATPIWRRSRTPARSATSWAASSPLDGRIALPSLDRRTVGLPLEDLRTKPLTVGLAAGAGPRPDRPRRAAGAGA